MMFARKNVQTAQRALKPQTERTSFCQARAKSHTCKKRDTNPLELQGHFLLLSRYLLFDRAIGVSGPIT